MKRHDVMIRAPTDEETLLLCTTMSQIDPWLKLGLAADSIFQNLKADTKRSILVILSPQGQIMGGITFRLTGACQLLLSRNWAADALTNYFEPSQSNSFPECIAYIHTLCVFPQFQGCGVGSQLLQKIEEEAKAISTTHLLLMVSSFNVNAQGFYSRLGFKHIGSVENCIVEGNTELLYVKKLSVLEVQ